MPNFCIQALEGNPITIYGDGTQTRSFCYVDDLVRGFLLLMETDGLAGGNVNLGNPEEITILQIAKQILELIPQSKSKIVHQPMPPDDPRPAEEAYVTAASFLEAKLDAAAAANPLARRIADRGETQRAAAIGTSSTRRSTTSSGSSAGSRRSRAPARSPCGGS